MRARTRADRATWEPMRLAYVGNVAALMNGAMGTFKDTPTQNGCSSSTKKPFPAIC